LGAGGGGLDGGWIGVFYFIEFLVNTLLENSQKHKKLEVLSKKAG